MTPLPREARDGLMRAWLKLLSDRHPNVTWVAAEQTTNTAGADAMTRPERR